MDLLVSGLCVSSAAPIVGVQAFATETRTN